MTTNEQKPKPRTNNYPDVTNSKIISNANYNSDKNELSLQSIFEKLQNIEQALTGSNIGNDGGLVGRIRELEDENIKQQQEVRDMRDDINKFKWVGTVILGIPTVIAIAKLLFDIVK